jgi:hypothetical protein
MSCVTCAKRPNASTSRWARRTCGAPREQPSRRHRGDLHVVRHLRQATECEYIAAGTKNARSPQGAAATTTSWQPARSARRALPVPIDEMWAHHGGHDECTELPGSSRHNDIVVTCASCVTCAKQPNTSTSRQARRTHGAPREQPSRLHRSDLHDLCVVHRPRQATKCGHTTAGTNNARSYQGAAAMMTLQRPARRASPAPSDRTQVHHGGHEERVELPGSSCHDDITATCMICVSCVTHVERLNTNTSWWAASRGQLPQHRSGHEERAEQPQSNHHNDIAATCMSCVTPPSD